MPADDYVDRLQQLRRSMDDVAQRAGGWHYDFEGLRQRLAAESPDARIEAARALRHYGESALAPLCLALRDADLRVRAAAAASLGELEDARALRPLIDTLRDCFVGRAARPDFWFGVFKAFTMFVALVVAVMTRGRARRQANEMLDQYADSRQRRNDLIHSITTAIGRIGERHPSAELRGVLPDLKVVSQDIVQQRRGTRAMSRQTAARIEMLTGRLQDLPLPAVDLGAGGDSLPHPSVEPGQHWPA